MDKISIFLITWGGLAVLLIGFLFWTYTKSGKNWLRNL